MCSNQVTKTGVTSSQFKYVTCVINVSIFMLTTPYRVSSHYSDKADLCRINVSVFGIILFFLNVSDMTF